MSEESKYREGQRLTDIEKWVEKGQIFEWQQQHLLYGITYVGLIPSARQS